MTKSVPVGSDAVPRETLRSERGLALYDAEPGRFRVARLAAVGAAYRRLLADAGLA